MAGWLAVCLVDQWVHLLADWLAEPMVASLVATLVARTVDQMDERWAVMTAEHWVEYLAYW